MDLVAENLACRRAGRLVFSGLSLNVRGGEAAVLRGPNGSGKSSLLRMLSGLLSPAAGAARIGDVTLGAFAGWDLAEVRPAARVTAVLPL